MLSVDDEHDAVQAAVDEAYGRIETPAWLAGDPRGWRALLAAAVQRADEQLAEVNRDRAELDAERHPPDEHARARADLAARRSRVMHFKRKMETRLRHVNAVLRSNSAAAHEEESDPDAVLRRAARLWRSQRGRAPDQATAFVTAAIETWNNENGDEA